ncbi:DUF378 domain-containing protein [Thermoflavimicrobium daqui]|uniref:DUF378 domain-containing protein n=1 Tax=Thermoflavimicrobium daqui TaxID=2137476 RepID=A0A364K6J8_9BACL|nr:DUF378 domain-containing protein [Thermoflavimicrobium daqui]RAL25925.1 DUF378 domain-containing protein [Thermoflavimicrobium daqui]
MERFALSLVIIGAINWLLVGIFQWDLVAAIFGGDMIRSSSPLARLIYTLVGLAGLYAIKFLFNQRESVNNQQEK